MVSMDKVKDLSMLLNITCEQYVNDAANGITEEDQRHTVALGVAMLMGTIVRTSAKGDPDAVVDELAKLIKQYARAS